LGFKEFGAMTEEKWKERHDWVEGHGIKGGRGGCWGGVLVGGAGVHDGVGPTSGW
jgi:hypothetical protein